jgi:hypothetical protein
MQDEDVLNEIKRLVEEEHGLLQAGPQRDLKPEEHARLKSLEISLDQCWDLLRQRRAQREFGGNANEAHVRDASTVERYEQ